MPGDWPDAHGFNSSAIPVGRNSINTVVYALVLLGAFYA
jgi:predicted cobalt transporter CbtA